MNEIPHSTTNRAESQHEISASNILASEVYTDSNRMHQKLYPTVAKLDLAQGDIHSETQTRLSVANRSAELLPKPYFGIGQTQGELFRHIGQTWQHVLTGNSTKLELLEFGIEAAGAAAMLRFGFGKLWSVKSVPKSSFSSAGDESILSQTLNGAQARSHPVMRMHIRTKEAPIIVHR